MNKEERISYHRFTDIDLSSDPNAIISIDEYINVPSVTIEEAIGKLTNVVPRIKENLEMVKRNLVEPKDDLTRDESASIRLYTYDVPPTPDSLCMILNKALRSRDKEKLHMWSPFLKLMFTGLKKLPNREYCIYRGIRERHEKSLKGQSFVWNEFSSCTLSHNVLERLRFFGNEGSRTLFEIVCLTGKNIKNHSYEPNDQEVILLPGTQFTVVEELTNGDLSVVRIEERKSSTVRPMSVQTKPTRTSSGEKWKLEEKFDINDSFSSSLFGVAIDKQHKNMYIADFENDEVAILTKYGERIHSLGVKYPSDILIDTTKQRILIASSGDKRIQSFSLDATNSSPKTIINNVNCSGIALDRYGNIYVSDSQKHEVRKYSENDQEGTIVAGGNGKGSGCNQLNHPHFVVVDEHDSIYISDSNNSRVVKWCPGHREGQVLLSEESKSSARGKLHQFLGLAIDANGTLYVADQTNNRVIRLPKSSSKPETIIDSNEVKLPIALSFDADNRLYVTGPKSLFRFSMIFLNKLSPYHRIISYNMKCSEIRSKTSMDDNGK